MAIEERLNKFGFQYSYHWMQADNKLIIRWDNSSKHPDIKTHPHHKHVGTEENIQPSEVMDLAISLRQVQVIEENCLFQKSK